MAEKIKLFTHVDMDGVGCAILAYLAFGKENVDVEYCGYDEIENMVSGFFYKDMHKVYDRIYITDISISEELAADIQYDVNTNNRYWRLFDHHGTALELNKFDWCKVRIDDEATHLKTCGTELFYDHLLVNKCFSTIPWDSFRNLHRFVDIVRNYDTWRWKELGDEGLVCKQFNDLFGIYGRDSFIERMYDLIRLQSCNIFPYLNETDLWLLDNKQKAIDKYVEKKNREMVNIQDRFGKLCGVVFAEQYFSELGNRLSEMHEELDYIAMIDISGKKVSYRTVRDDIDLGKEIAHSYGGGGHAKAAGSTFGEEVWFDVMCRLFGEDNTDDVLHGLI